MTEKQLIEAGFRYAFSLTHDHNQAHDLVQESWLRLFEKNRYKLSKALLFRVIRNLFVDQCRRNKFVVIDGLADMDLMTDPKTNENFEPDTGDMGSALKTLRPEEREAIMLNVVEGYSAKEIGKLMQKSRGTILSLIYRGKQKLADRLRELQEARQLARTQRTGK